MRRGLVVFVATVMAFIPTGAGAAEPAPDIIRVGSRVWVSVPYLRAHPEVLPGIEMRDGQARFVTARGGRHCDGQACVRIVGDGLFVDRFETTYYSNGSEGPKHAHFMWTPAGAGVPQSVFHYDIAPGPDEVGRPGVYYDTEGPTGVFAAGSRACAEWIPGSGVPCLSIKR
ncbi:hypothetical protein [Nocardia suismassiliense]|uniref:hypothetical protein n=1 Tax=Nocardia suismassiliense TaxID=2077092 RepID=UPI00131EDD3F|nr:hypothetical protein [Nocardia suismassiliense]